MHHGFFSLILCPASAGYCSLQMTPHYVQLQHTHRETIVTWYDEKILRSMTRPITTADNLENKTIPSVGVVLFVVIIEIGARSLSI